MLKIYIISFLIIITTAFNISNMNDHMRQKFIVSSSNILKTYGAYSVDKMAKNYFEEGEEEKHKKSYIHPTHNLENTLFFYSQVDEHSSMTLEQKLLALNQHNIHLLEKYEIEKAPIHLHIQSFGGSLFHTLYLVDLIKSLETPVYTYVDGFAASAATLLSISGKRRFMSKNSLMLIHQLSGGNAGKYAEMKDENENLDVLMDFIVNHYLENTKIDQKTLLELLKRDLWLNSSTCLKYGLVDEISNV